MQKVDIMFSVLEVERTDGAKLFSDKLVYFHHTYIQEAQHTAGSVAAVH